MGLQEAVLEVASNMEREADNASAQEMGLSIKLLLKSFARELRTAVRASEGTPPTSQPVPFMSPMYQHHVMVEEARKEFQRSKDGAQAQERVEPRKVEISGGDLDGTLADVDQQMPVDAYTEIAGSVYQLQRDGKLHLV